MRRTTLLCAVLCFVCPATGRAVLAEEDSLQIVLRSGTFGVVEARGGQTIEMEGFDFLKEPGRPMLPERETLVLLPPGARALSLEVEELDTRQLPGKFAIAPTPPFLPLSHSPASLDAVGAEMAEWKRVNRAAYSDDRAYPRETVRIVGSGTLRKYAYVRVAFRPFAYRASSGRLVLHDTVRARIDYELPDPASAEAALTATLLGDTLADERAAAEFANYDDLRALYEPEPTDASVRSGLAHHDYVIITTPELLGAITASGFLDWKASLGFDVRTVLTTDPEIGAQAGSDIAERIRNFLRANYAPWGIEYVLLVGDYADVPMRLCYPDPQNHLHDPPDPGTGPGSVPTDAYYADLSLPDAESWDADGDGFHGEYGEDHPDFLAEVNVGRIPTSDGFRITYTLDKLVAVEADVGAWKRHALHAGAILFFENQDGQDIPLRDGAVCVDEIETDFMQGWTVSRYSEQSGLVPSIHRWPALTLPAFIGDWNGGTYGFVNWAGHGWPDQVARTIWSWDDGDGVPETNGSDGFYSEAFLFDPTLLDDDYPSIVCAVSCDVGYPEPNPYGNLGVKLLTDPAMGSASAVMSASRYAAVSGDWPAVPGGAESLCYEFNRYLIAGPGGPGTLGAATYESQFFAHVSYGWDHHYEYRNLYDYNLYGDPSMDWRGAGIRTGNLLRNTDVTQLDPPTPPVGDCLPLDPVDDLHVADFVAGDVDPDPADGSSLVFYAIDAPVRIWVHRRPSGEIQIDF
jgi:hypothetical protein